MRSLPRSPRRHPSPLWALPLGAAALAASMPGCATDLEAGEPPAVESAPRALLLSPPGEDGEPGEPVAVVRYDVVDGLNVVGGDIVVPDEQLRPLEDADPEVIQQSLTADADPRRLWPLGTVPYTIDGSLANPQLVHDAIAHVEQVTPLRFVPRRGEDDYLVFTRNAIANVGRSYVGRIGGGQSVWLGDRVSVGVTVHEIGHAIGLFHEHTRPDRDEHVRVRWDNVEEGYERAFARVDGAYTHGGYDFASVMHYGPDYFSRNGEPTLVRRSDGQPVPRSSGELSSRDVLGVRALYRAEFGARDAVVLTGNFGPGVPVVRYHPDGTWEGGRRTSAQGFNFQGWGAFSTTTGWVTHLADDVNGDGLTDVLSYHGASGRWWVGISDGARFRHELWTTYNTRTGWVKHLTGDFDGDGRADLASYHEASGRWWVSRFDGRDHRLDLWAQYSTNRGWGPYLAADFDGDGRDDIATFHEGSGRWWVSRSLADRFQPALWIDFSTDSGWAPQLVGDFNGDGRADIANYHEGSGRWWVCESTGRRFVARQWTEFSTRAGWSPQLAADFDGDGRDDIGSYHEASGRWWISRSTGGSFTTDKWLDFGEGVRFSTQLAVDVDGDGDADLVHRGASDSWSVSISTGRSFSR